MKIAFATTFNTREIGRWSGTPFHMANGFHREGVQVEYIDTLKRRLPPFFKLTQLWKKLMYGERESPRFNMVAAKYYSKQAANKISALKVNAILSPQVNPIAFLDCKTPIILWTDSVYASLLNDYPGFSSHSKSSISQGNRITEECLSRCTLTIFSSEWAAQSAMKLYGLNKEKIHIVPFGANIERTLSLEEIRQLIKSRSRHTIQLLFIGKHWHRKGGDMAFNIANALHKAGQPVELHFIGCSPPKDTPIPTYIKCYGFISKATPAGMAKITELLSQSHFLIVPSRAEAYGLVFCEANAFGVPSLSSNVGGIQTIIKNNINGMTFALGSNEMVFCDYIMDLMKNYSRYEELALSSFNEYQTRLNWGTATRTVKQWINERV